MTSVLFICLGNICRSPALEATLKTLLNKRGIGDQIFVDSCGLEPYHPGGPPDPRMVAAALKWDVHIDSRSKGFKEEYFDTYSHLFAVDKKIFNRLNCFRKSTNKLALATKYSRQFPGKEIPDPFIATEDAFSQVMEIIYDASVGIASYLENHL